MVEPLTPAQRQACQWSTQLSPALEEEDNAKNPDMPKLEDVLPTIEDAPAVDSRTPRPSDSASTLLEVPESVLHAVVSAI